MITYTNALLGDRSGCGLDCRVKPGNDEKMSAEAEHYTFPKRELRSMRMPLISS
jgi:hypothetical protein